MTFKENRSELWRTSLYQVGTNLSPNHGHAAFMSAFGMLGMVQLVLRLGQVLIDEQWVKSEKHIRISFWGLKLGLVLMILRNLGKIR